MTAQAQQGEISKHKNLFWKKFYKALSKAVCIRKKSKVINQQFCSKHKGRKHKHERKDSRWPFFIIGPTSWIWTWLLSHILQHSSAELEVLITNPIEVSVPSSLSQIQPLKQEEQWKEVLGRRQCNQKWT